MELFEEKVGEVNGGDGRRYILRRNPRRQQELAQGREQKRQAVEMAVQKRTPTWTPIRARRRARNAEN